MVMLNKEGKLVPVNGRNLPVIVVRELITPAIPATSPEDVMHYMEYYKYRVDKKIGDFSFHVYVDDRESKEETRILEELIKHSIRILNGRA